MKNAKHPIAENRNNYIKSIQAAKDFFLKLPMRTVPDR